MQPWIQVLLLSILIFVISLFLIRLIGKRNVTRSTPFKFVSYTVIAIIVALISVGIVNFVYGLIALGVWVLLTVGFDFLSIKSKWFHDILNGKETVLMKHGKIMEENLLQTGLTGEELQWSCRSRR